MKNFSKNIILWVIIGLLLIALFNLFQNTSSNKGSTEISFSDFITATENGNISEVNITGNDVQGYFEDGRPFYTCKLILSDEDESQYEQDVRELDILL